MADTHITGNPYDGYAVHGAWGSAQIKTAGIELDLHCVQSVGLDNLCDVQSHTINRIACSTSHVIRFFGGGHVQFAYNDQGQLLEFSGLGVQLRLEQGGKCLHFSPYSLPRGTRMA